ncbi:hypothetical protein ACHAWF_008908 [Thalassiosira exigua]
MKAPLRAAAAFLGAAAAALLPPGAVAEFRRFDGPIHAASNYIHYSEGYVVTPGFIDFVDIVVFHEPPSCTNTRLGCDWTELGVGANDGVGNLRWCCSDDASSLGLCGGPEQEGRLIVDKQKFTGHHSSLAVAPSGKWKRAAKYGMFDLKEVAEVGTGKYVLVVSNCNDEMGRNLTVSGRYVFKSAHGYLPGNLFGEMYFFSAVTILYLILFAWYAIKMSIYRDEIIPIQQWVLVTIGIGLLEVFFKAGDLWVWNVDGDRFWFSLYTGVVIGVLKRAISRCLVLMLCLGWGVTCDTLGDKMARVVAMGIAYAGTSTARDVMTVLAITENEVLSNETENDIWDVVTILTFVTAFIDVSFYLWIFDALSGTMKYLEDMNQSRKLKRYLRLRMILLLSVLFAVVWTVFGIVDAKNDQRIINEEVNGWVLSAVWEVNYLVVLGCLSCLWAPEAGAKEYAYVMELSQIGNDLEFDTTMVDGPESDDEGGEPGSGGFTDAEPKLDVDKGVHS